MGQHFLRDQNIARKIVDSLGTGSSEVLEIGPGMGVLTRFLLQRPELNVHLVEIDHESVNYLKSHFPEIEKRIYQEDFLRWELSSHRRVLRAIESREADAAGRAMEKHIVEVTERHRKLKF